MIDMTGGALAAAEVDEQAHAARGGLGTRAEEDGVSGVTVEPRWTSHVLDDTAFVVRVVVAWLVLGA